jgi:hypothetical protein
VANLRGDSGSPNFAQRLNGNTFLRANGPSATVFDDNTPDSLFGNSGRDWFFANTGTTTGADFVWMLEQDELVDGVG